MIVCIRVLFSIISLVLDLQHHPLEKEIADTMDYMNRHFNTQRKMIDNLVLNTQGIRGDIDAYTLPPGGDGGTGSEPSTDGDTEL